MKHVENFGHPCSWFTHAQKQFVKESKLKLVDTEKTTDKCDNLLTRNLGTLIFLLFIVFLSWVVTFPGMSHFKKGNGYQKTRTRDIQIQSAYFLTVWESPVPIANV